MIEPWLIYVLIFAAVFLAVQFFYLYLSEGRRTQRRVHRRFAGIENPLSAERQVELVKRQDTITRFAGGPLKPIGTLVAQSGVRLSPLRLGVMFLAAWGAIFLALFSVSSTGLRAAIAGVAAALLLMGFLHWKRLKRIGAFSEQLPDVIDIIVRSLKAGHPLSVSLSLVSREMREPAGSEFALTFDEITYGREVREALENLYHRVGYEDLRLLVTSISVSHQTGGNLGDILTRLSKMLRERFKMKRKIKALTSEGRFSAVVLSLLPVVMYGVINLINPDYYAAVWDEPLLEIAATLAGILLVIGNFVMYKMVNFKF